MSKRDPEKVVRMIRPTEKLEKFGAPAPARPVNMVRTTTVRNEQAPKDKK